MFIDKQTMVSNAQAVTASAGSTDYIDLGAARDIGVSDDIIFAITVNETATAAGAATVQVSIQADDNTSFSSPETVASTGALALADLAAGRDAIFLRANPYPKQRYLRAYFTVGTGPLTAGKFTVAVVEEMQRNVAYPDAL